MTAELDDIGIDDDADFDPVAHHAGREPDLKELFSAPVVADGVMGDSLIDSPNRESAEPEDRDELIRQFRTAILKAVSSAITNADKTLSESFAETDHPRDDHGQRYAERKAADPADPADPAAYYTPDEHAKFCG